jgi:dolichol-phosphate mannosyltransferase
MRAARGECCAVMDCDLQHPPETVPEMYRLWREEGYEIVEGIKLPSGRARPLRRLCNGLFYRIMSACVGFDMEASSDFKLLDRRVRDILCAMPERETFFRALTFWVGFRTARVTYAVGERSRGKTKWPLRRLIRYAVRSVSSFSSAPLYFVAWMGLFLLIFALVLGVQTLIRWFSGTAVEGFTTVILLLLIIGGGLMVALGIIGYYIARIYTEIKGRPRCIVMQTCGDGAEEPDRPEPSAP